MADQQAMTAYEEQRRVISAQQTAQAVQQVYWDEMNKRKRAAPSPALSMASTPAHGQPDQAASSTTPPTEAVLVVPWALQDHVAAQQTASHLGVDANNEQAMQEWLAQPVKTNKDVLTVLRSYHERVIRPEMYNLVLQLETALKTVSDQVFATRRELAWMASENRLLQKHQSGVQLIASGWPTGLAPEMRLYQIGWMLSQCPKIVSFLQGRLFAVDHPANMTVFLNVCWL